MLDDEPTSENVANRFSLIPLDRAPELVLKMLSRFAEGLPEPMIIGDKGEPTAALIPIDDFCRLREYDQRALDSEESFYAELNQRIHHSETESAVMVDFDMLTRRLQPPDA